MSKTLLPTFRHIKDVRVLQCHVEGEKWSGWDLHCSVTKWTISQQLGDQLL